MVQVVLSLQEETNQRLRRLARELKGGRKGALSEVVTEALSEYEKQAKRLHAIKKLKQISAEGWKLGIGKFSRDKLYDK